ncbi:hypothetical protein DAPPUDRAFT_259338 [Daphnia pulex]|uniref:Uncharacterized protein n=1 Tax=Daphnia pulex TaxID=6669 RepID=E9HH39_DAPPU|nr:hypothetical protein DAPPUDRAFT_259338 [Daphnia pulex]|eukprot:EFX68927.1 hypothetical protein DAPPUDRAFT_259338 [Daphnia pulex]
MQVIDVLLICLAAANAFYVPASTFVRASAHDSAVIKSDRLGGNFAYSTVEGHAYAVVNPVVQRVLISVRVSHHAVPTPYFGYPAYGYAGYPYGSFVAPAAVDAKAGQPNIRKGEERF